MKLVLIGRGRWTVYAICSDERTCPLLDFVAGLDEKRGSKVLSDLREWVPFSDPSEWVRIDFSWKLRGTESILEFRWPTKRGGTPRVYWFYDTGSIVVCSHGTNKKGDTDPQDIEAAEAAEVQYLESKRTRQLTIVPLKEFDPPDDEENEDG